MTPQKEAFAQPTETEARTLDRGDGRGRCVPRPLRPAASDAGNGGRKMAAKPVILALANPTPEIDAGRCAVGTATTRMIATGRSDYPNQVNNVLCFPFIFRGALDVGATGDQRRNGARLRASAHGRRLRARPARPRRRRAYSGRAAGLRPRLSDPEAVRPPPPAHRRGGGRRGRHGLGRRLAAHRRSRAYRQSLETAVHRSAFVMRPVFEARARR